MAWLEKSSSRKNVGPRVEAEGVQGTEFSLRDTVTITVDFM